MNSIPNSSDNTPSSPLNQSDDSDNVSSNTLENINEYEEETCPDISKLTSVPDTISDKLSTGAIHDDLSSFNFISFDDIEGGQKNEDNVDKTVNQKTMGNSKKSVVSKTSVPKASESAKQFRTSVVEGSSTNSKFNRKESVADLCKTKKASFLRSSFQEGKFRDKKAPTVRISCHDNKEPPVSARSCPIPTARRRQCDYNKFGLLKATKTAKNMKKAPKKVNDVEETEMKERLSYLQDMLALELNRNAELTAELDQCQNHMREAAAAYADLGKLAILERRRAENAELRLEDANNRIAELQALLENQKSKVAAGPCNAAISSFIDDNGSSSDAISKIEASLKSVLLEVDQFRKSGSRTASDSENSIPLTRDTDNWRPKSPQTNRNYQQNSQINDKERKEELRRMVQLLIAKRTVGSFRP